MRTILILVAASALGGCPAETQQTCGGGAVVNGRCANSVCGEAGVRSDGYCNDDPSAPVAVPAARRSHTVATEKAIDGFDVEVRPAGAIGWDVRVTSKIDVVSSVLFDESTFVLSNGDAAGRLISGDTRKMDTAKAQPPLPVAPHASVSQFVLPEKLIETEEAEAKLMQRTIPQRDLPRVEKIRANRETLIVGGKLYVTVQGPSGRQTWVGVVVPSGGGG